MRLKLVLELMGKIDVYRNFGFIPAEGQRKFGIENTFESEFSSLIIDGDVESALPSINGASFIQDEAIVTQSNEQAHTGNNSAKYTLTASGQEAWKAPSYSISGLTETNYQLIFWLYVAGDQNWASSAFGVTSNGPTNGVQNWLTLLGSNSDFTYDTWVEHTVNITEEGDEDWIFDFTTIGTNNDFIYIDDISFKEII